MSPERLCSLDREGLAAYVWSRLNGASQDPPLADRFRQESPAEILIAAARLGDDCRGRILAALGQAFRRYIRELVMYDEPPETFIDTAAFLVERMDARELHDELRGLLIALMPTRLAQPVVSVRVLTRLMQAFLKTAHAEEPGLELLLGPYATHSSPQVRATAVWGLALAESPAAEAGLEILLRERDYDPSLLVWNLARTQSVCRMLGAVGARDQDLDAAIVEALRFSGGDNSEALDRYRAELRVRQALETPIGDDEDSHLDDVMQDSRVASSVEREATRNMLASLTSREASVLRIRFGIDTTADHTLEGVGRCFDVTADHTLEDVGRQLDVARERIRQIQARALRKLSPSRAEKLRSLLDKD